MKEEVDEVTGFAHPVILESPDEKKQPKVAIKDPKTGKIIKEYLLPAKAHMMVQDKDPVVPGSIIAKIPRETTKTKDITGGLPRVVELFEARRPKEPAVITEIDGAVQYGEVVKGKRKLIVTDDETGEARDYDVPKGVHINIQEGERVRAGEPLIDGPRDPHDILRVNSSRTNLFVDAHVVPTHEIPEGGERLGAPRVHSRRRRDTPGRTLQDRDDAFCEGVRELIRKGHDLLAE